MRDGAGNVHVELLKASARHDDELMPAIERLVEKAGLTPRDLEAVGVSIGPGGYPRCGERGWGTTHGPG